ncbi:MAG: glycerophosphodiester phosphodiesterase [Alphaproteobacteria bacterium]
MWARRGRAGANPGPAMDLPRIIGHRGAAAHAPENTLASLDRAAALGAAWVEFDVKLTADNHCILFHDDTLERTTNGHGPVAATTYDEISRLDAGSWFGPEFAGEPVPRLDTALDQVLDLDLHAEIEIKPCPGREVETAEAVMAEVSRCWPRGRPPLIASFEAECLAVARAAAPEWPRVLNCFRVPRDWRRQLEALDCRILACLYQRLTQRNVARMTTAGITVVAFTVNEPDRAAELLEWGVSTIVTDAPEVIMPIAVEAA